MSDRSRHGVRVAFPLFLLLSAVPFAFAQTATETVTLTQAIQAALQGGPDAKIVGLTLEAAQVQYDQAAAKASSNLNGNASAGYSDQFGAVPDPIPWAPVFPSPCRGP